MGKKLCYKEGEPPAGDHSILSTEDTAKLSKKEELTAFPHHEKNQSKFIIKIGKTQIPSTGTANLGKTTVLYMPGERFIHISKSNSTLNPMIDFDLFDLLAHF